MSDGNVKHTSQNVENQRMFYYAGTETIERGYVFTFVENATENGSDPADRLGYTIEKPTTAGLMMCAGVYSGKEGSFVGPGYLTLNIPTKRTPVEAYTDADMTVGVSALAPQNGSFALGVHADATTNLALVGMAMVTVDTDTVNALSTIMWL